MTLSCSDAAYSSKVARRRSEKEGRDVGRTKDGEKDDGEGKKVEEETDRTRLPKS
jgi:hypothetical protein